MREFPTRREGDGRRAPAALAAAERTTDVAGVGRQGSPPPPRPPPCVCRVAADWRRLRSTGPDRAGGFWCPSMRTCWSRRPAKPSCIRAGLTRGAYRAGVRNCGARARACNGGARARGHRWRPCVCTSVGASVRAPRRRCGLEGALARHGEGVPGRAKGHESGRAHWHEGGSRCTRAALAGNARAPTCT